MGVMLWLLALVWAGSGVQVLYAQSSSRSRDNNLDHNLNRSYVDMMKSIDGRAPSNLDVTIVYFLQMVSGRIAIRVRDAVPITVSKDVLEDFIRVKNGVCVSPESRKEIHSQNECLTLGQVREVVAKEIVFSMYNIATITMEAMTETRLQFYIEKDSEDFVLFLSHRIETIWKEMMPTFAIPVASVLTNVYRFRDILSQRYTMGIGSPESLVRAADDVARGIYSVIHAFAVGNLTIQRALKTAGEKFQLFTVMFTHNFGRIFSTALERGGKGSAYSSITRYWDARAMDYAVTWLFRLKSSLGEDTYKMDDLLIKILEKQVAGDMKAAMNLAKRGLADFKNKNDKLRPVVGKLPSVKLPLVGTLTPPPVLQDLNLLGVPTTLREVEELEYEEIIRSYLEDLGGKEVAEYLLGSS